MSVTEQGGPLVWMLPTVLCFPAVMVLNKCSAPVRPHEPIKVSSHQLAGTDLTFWLAGKLIAAVISSFCGVVVDEIRWRWSQGLFVQ